MILKQSIFPYLLVAVAIVVFTSQPLVAQKKSSKTKAQPFEMLSDEKALMIETLLIEGQKQVLLENYSKAFEVLTKCLELDPNNAAVHYKLAEIQIRTGNNDKALYHIDKAISVGSDNKYYYLMKAEILKAMMRIEDAIKVYELMVQNISDTQPYFLDIGSLYQYQGKWDKALAAYTKAEEAVGLSEFILAEKQAIYLRKNDMKGLMAEYDKYIEFYKDDPVYLLEIVSVLLANEMLVEADARYKILYKRFPDLPQAMIVGAELARKRGDFDQVFELLQVAIKSLQVELVNKLQMLNSITLLAVNQIYQDRFYGLLELLTTTHPDRFEALAFAGDVYMQLGKTEQALGHYLKATKIGQVNFGVWQNIVNLQWQLERYEEVVKNCETALEYFPTQAIFYFYGGTGYYLLKDYKKSVRMLEQGKKYTNEPGLLSIFFGQLGDAYHSLKDFENSDKSYLKALEYDPNNDHVLNNFSYFLSLRKQQMEKALEMSGRLVKEFPDNPTYLDTHGWVLYVLGRYDEALVFLAKSVTLDDDGTILEHYGDVLFKTGKKDQAIEYWIKAKEKGGVSDLIDQKIKDQQLYE